MRRREQAPALLSTLVLLAALTLCSTAEPALEGPEMPGASPEAPYGSQALDTETAWEMDNSPLVDPDEDVAETDDYEDTGLMEVSAVPAAAAPAPAPVAPVISVASKVRAIEERNRLKNDQKLRVIKTVEERKTAVERAITEEAEKDATDDFNRQVAKAKAKGVALVNEEIASEKHLKGKRARSNAITRAGIRRMFDRIKNKRHEVRLSVEKKVAHLQKKLKDKLGMVNGKIQAAEVQQKKAEAMRMAAVKERNTKKGKAQLARAKTWTDRFNSIKKRDSAEVHLKKMQEQKYAALLAMKLHKRDLTLHSRTVTQLEDQEWLKLHGPTAKKMQRLLRRAKRKIGKEERKHDRQARRKMSRATRLLSKKTNKATRNVRRVARAAWNVLQKGAEQGVTPTVRVDSRRRYIGSIESEAEEVADEPLSATNAADAAVDQVIAQQPYVPHLPYE